MSPGDAVLLPRASEAEVPEDKLRRYALDPGHRTGAHKARVFGSALGVRAATGDTCMIRSSSASSTRRSRPSVPSPHMASSTRFA